MNHIINLHKRKLTRMKANGMKMIVFSKSWKYVTMYYKGENIHLQNKKVWKGLHESRMGPPWKNVQRLKGIINFNSLKKGWSFLRTSNSNSNSNGIHIFPIWHKVQFFEAFPKQDVHGTHGPPCFSTKWKCHQWSKPRNHPRIHKRHHSSNVEK